MVTRGQNVGRRQFDADQPTLGTSDSHRNASQDVQLSFTQELVAYVLCWII